MLNKFVHPCAGAILSSLYCANFTIHVAKVSPCCNSLKLSLKLPDPVFPVEEMLATPTWMLAQEPQTTPKAHLVRVM